MDIRELEEIVLDITGKKIFIQNCESKISNLDIDSLNYLEVIVEMENRTGINFSDDSIFKCNTVNDLLNLVNSA
jgi:acyl carrier protein